MKNHNLKLVEPPKPKRGRKRNLKEAAELSSEFADIINDRGNLGNYGVGTITSKNYRKFGLETGDCIFYCKSAKPKYGEIVKFEYEKNGQTFWDLKVYMPPLTLAASEGNLIKDNLNETDRICGVVKYIIRRAEVQR